MGDNDPSLPRGGGDGGGSSQGSSSTGRGGRRAVEYQLRYGRSVWGPADDGATAAVDQVDAVRLAIMPLPVGRSLPVLYQYVVAA